MLIEATMRYDRERDVVWVWPEPNASYFVPRATLEKLAESRQLAEDELIGVCRDYEEVFTGTAARKRKRGQCEADGYVVITSDDIHTCT